MKRFSNWGKTALVLGFCFCCGLNAAEAKATKTTAMDFRAKGVNAKYLDLICMSTDNEYICFHSREPRDKDHDDFRNNVYVFKVNADNSLGSYKKYTITGIPSIEQLNFTPDNKSIIMISKMGATILKLDLASGKVTTIMEHIKGQPGFKVFPNILMHSDGELLIQGYFYDKDTFCGPNTICVLNYNKTGLDAFTLASDVDKMQVETRRGHDTVIENFTRKDTGFWVMDNKDKSWSCYRWIDGKGVKEFDHAQEVPGLWGSESRLLYSAKRAPNSYDLVVYDAKTDEKFKISEGRRTPYSYVFLADSGKTAIFNDINEQTKTTQIMYARESEGWAPKPLQGLDRRIPMGIERIALDGRKVMYLNDDFTLYIADIEE
ncbi:MAG: hypothetical protein Q4F00_06755 [bacterium]|nr:hypothetical protein [bacterium]